MKHKLTSVTLVMAALPLVASAQVVNPGNLVCHSSVAQCSAHVPGNKLTSVHDHQQQVYGPQGGWVIYSYVVHVTQANGNHTEQYTSNPAGTFASSSGMTQAYNQAFNLVAGANLPPAVAAQINLALSNSYNTNVAYNNNLSSSYGNVTLTDDAQGTGIGGAGSYSTQVLDVCLLPIEPSMANDAAFKTMLLTWTSHVIRQHQILKMPDWIVFQARLIGPQVRGLESMAALSGAQLSPAFAKLVAETDKALGWKPVTKVHGMKGMERGKGKSSGKTVKFVAPEERSVSEVLSLCHVKAVPRDATAAPIGGKKNRGTGAHD